MRRSLGAGRICAAAVAALIVAVVCCRPAPADQPTQEAQVREALQSFVKAFNNLDWDAFRSWFAADATLFNPDIPQVSRLTRIDGKSGIETSFRAVFESTRHATTGPPYLHIAPRNVLVQMLKDAAVVTFEFGREGGSTGRRTLVFRKEQGGWRIIHIHASNVSPRTGP